MMKYPDGLNRYGLHAWAWNLRLGEPEPNKDSLINLGNDIENLVQSEMLAWANGDYHDTDLEYQDETENQLRLDVEIGLVQKVIESMVTVQLLTEAERDVLAADSVSARSNPEDLKDWIGQQMVEAKQTGTPLLMTGLSPTDWFPTEIETLAEMTGISMYDL